MSNEVSASSFRVNFSIIKFSPLNNHRHTLQQTLQSEIRGDISPSHNKRQGFVWIERRAVKRVSSIGGSHFRFAGHLRFFLFLALLSPPCLSLRGEHAGTGHSGGKYSWRAGFGEFADYRTGNFNDPFHDDLPQEKGGRCSTHQVFKRYVRRAPSYGAQSASFCMNHRKSSVGLCSVPVLLRLDIDCQFFFDLSIPLNLLPLPSIESRFKNELLFVYKYIHSFFFLLS